MKKIILTLTATILFFVLNAQTPIFNITITQPTNGDTLIMPLSGVIAGPLAPPNSLLPDITSQLQDIGITSIRNNDNYDDKLDMEALFRCPHCFSTSDSNQTCVPAWCCDPNDTNNLHFEASDTLYRAIHDGGFSLFFRLGGESQSGLTNQHHIYHGPIDSVEEDNWIQAAIHVVEHYDNFEGTQNQLDYLDIMTEWPNSLFWQRSDNEFISFFTRTLDTLKHHFPNKKIGGPGFLVPTVFVVDGDVNNKATDLLNSLYHNNVKPDFISWHLWNLDPYNYYKAGEQYRDLLDGTGDFSSVDWAGTGFFNGVEIICGAWGTPKLNIPEYTQYILYNKQKGAALLSADWIAMQETNTVRAYYYRDADPNSNPDTTIGDVGGSGLFYGDASATYKPKAYAFKLWGRLYDEFPQKMSNDFPVVTPDSSKLWVLSAKNDQGAYGLVVANTDSIEKKLTVNIQGTTVDTSNYNILYYTVNDDNNGDIAEQNYDNEFTIPLQSVVFIRILPENYLNISEIKANDEIKIYPNPSTGIIHIGNIDIYNVEVTDITGKIIMKKDNCNTNIVDLSKQQKGIYLIKIYNDEIMKIEKIIIN